MPHSAGPQENGSGTLPCQRRSHAQGSIFETGCRRVREELLTTALKLMSTQGIQHTTVEQVYRSVGISRSFFYAFFPTKEDLNRRGALSAAAPPAGICPQPDGRPVNQLAGRGAAVPGYLLLWRQEWGGGAQRG
ncbi:MAG: TetR/AcrR family transcriptional regulator [Acutalibacteraceae bacterium]